MIIEDKGIIVAIKRFQESSFIIKALLENHGIVSGLYKTRKKNTEYPDVASIVRITWKARLQEHLGLFQCEQLLNIPALICYKKIQTTIASAALAMIDMLISEREPQNTLYRNLEQLLVKLNMDDVAIDQYLSDYVKLEIFDILASAGFGLDLTKCKVTGTSENLKYISPKSASAISLEVGAPYHQKLMPLPQFLIDHSVTASISDILVGLEISEYFLETHLLKPMNKTMPVYRKLLSSYVARLYQTSD
ncbi:DNA repair protein RecO [Rickettsiales endosymbiont of Peranema trichophorum]|uniref:DNA repair protein RecO n=1 Tax=Rickettsiales endosymbiont of Peranema trichophorum TaxID=2486577 RepID=UPI001022CCF0|nr:DNA repair protein RecO [Rickettsiales endosymbiont of Peranema trichophorum]RZI47732.1 DNA repair protein RecO [Rickettsiales endosymbiont of Peranema trichophorum]